MAEPKFYRCNECGNILVTIQDSGVRPVCCGEKMELLNANTTDAAQEKHVPVVEKLNDDHTLKVTVGSTLHPMDPDHLIEWIALVSDTRTDIHYLKAGEEPSTVFRSVESGTVYAYCNKHGLWKTEF